MNRWMLEAKIRENGYTMQSFASMLKIDRATLWRKLEGKSKFTIDEVRAICGILHISPQEYFFADVVAYPHTFGG